ncbi:MAG TPA: hypothetical protein VF252_10430 [Gemmatimonadales bacterium]
MTAAAGLRCCLVALSCGAILSLAACEQWHLSVNGDGLLFVSVISDDGHPRDRFRVRTRDSNGVVRIRDLPSSGRLTLSPTAAGPLELTLLPPDGCSVAGPNPQFLTVAAGTSVRASFDVRCE